MLRLCQHANASITRLNQPWPDLRKHFGIFYNKQLDPEHAQQRPHGGAGDALDRRRLYRQPHGADGRTSSQHRNELLILAHLRNHSHLPHVEAPPHIGKKLGALRGLSPRTHDSSQSSIDEDRMTNREQVSVPLPPELRAFVARVAEQEDRSQASVIRKLVAEAARKSE